MDSIDHNTQYRMQNEDIFDCLLAYDDLFLESYQSVQLFIKCEHIRSIHQKFTLEQSQENFEKNIQNSTQSFSQHLTELKELNFPQNISCLQANKNNQAETFKEISRYILNFEPIKQNQTTNNIPKFLLKILKQYFPKDYKIIVGNIKFPQKFNQFFKRVTNRRRLPNLKLIHKLLTLQLSDEIDQVMNRKIMWYILGNRKKEEILNNKKVVKKSLYSLSAKVFRLRCRSRMLTKRASLK